MSGGAKFNLMNYYERIRINVGKFFVSSVWIPVRVHMKGLVPEIIVSV